MGALSIGAQSVGRKVGKLIGTFIGSVKFRVPRSMSQVFENRIQCK